MSRVLFEQHAKDLEYDLSFNDRFNMYTSSETQKAWRMWNTALTAKDAAAETEEPIVISVDDILEAGLYFNWSQAKCGFGQLSIGFRPDGTVSCMNECMSKRWVRKALHAAIDTLVDAAELEDKM